MYCRTDDPIRDFERYDREQTERIKKLPRCSECDNPIQDEYGYYINDEWICPECIEQYRKPIEEDI